jgi:hypothetical protein
MKKSPYLCKTKEIDNDLDTNLKIKIKNLKKDLVD